MLRVAIVVSSDVRTSARMASRSRVKRAASSGSPRTPAR
jgi:hypothetical protein